MTTTDILIIGAGPAGLACAGRLRKAGIDFLMLEKSNEIGHSWVNHYDRLHLHTVKELSHLPHIEFPENYPRYVPREKLVRYMEEYAKEMRIEPLFEEEVAEISKTENDQWLIQTKKDSTFQASQVIIATGVNRVPNVPSWTGQDSFKGEIIHSRKYKNPQPFMGKKVLVIGMGNTGAELALDLAEHGIETYISVRSPISVVPRDLNGRPVQTTSKKLAKLPFGFGDWLGTQIRKIYFGNLSKYNLESSKMHPAVQLRETGKTPVVDIGTIQAIKDGKIKVLKGINKFSETGIHFKNGEHHDFDAVILATGYKAKVEDFLERGEEVLDKYACPKAAIGEGYHEGIYFVGFDNYKLGGILGTIFTDSESILEDIKRKNAALV
ncbi:MAG: NAD(P)/FAD-dependent oxidoreductase [Bacteroidota bacterium]